MTDLDVEAGPLEPLLQRIRGRVPGPRAELVAGLARAAYRRAGAALAGPEEIDASVDRFVAGIDLIDARTPGQLALRVHTPGPGGTVVEVNVEDSPFLLSTVTEELARLGLDPVDAVHPVFGVERDAEGRLEAVLPAREAPQRESWIRAELGRELREEEREEVEDALRRVLHDALAATGDFRAMQAQVGEIAFQTRASAGARYGLENVDETVAFLDWLLDDHFILLGYREYDLRGDGDDRTVAVRPGSGLGILADETSSRYAEPVSLSALAPDLRAQVEGGDLLIVSRTNRVSTVHRREQMVYVGVKKVDGQGGIGGEYRLLGLFAQKAFAEAASSIPVLRRKLRTILEWEDIVEHSHDERAIRTLFEAIPKPELFEADTAELHASVMQLLEAQKRQRVRLLCRADPRGRSVSALVVVPRDRFNVRVRERIQTLLADRFAAHAVDYHLSMTERDQALLHFVLHTSTPAGSVPIDELEREVLELTRTWEDDLADALEAEHGPAEGRRLARRYAGVFPPGYTDSITARDAITDIAELAALQAEGAEGVRMALRARNAGESTSLRFQLYKAGQGVELSSFLPILESLGLTVVEEIPHRLDVDGGVTLHDFGVRLPEGVSVDADHDGARLADAARAVYDGKAEADSLNRLVLHAGLDWQDVSVLRAYRRYRRQVGTTFTDAYQADALVGHHEVAAALAGLFAARFDPRLADQPEAVEEARARVKAACDAVERLDQDRILRGFLGMVEATLRTNRYLPHRTCLALKLDSAQVPDMPKPVPYVEVFVTAPDMEGVHLRGGPVARGGIRWSDRQEDVRTEVLGLMKAQMVKNAIIVPTGSKGGFVLKNPPAAPARLADEVHEVYQRYIRGLLDLTDNIVAGRCVTPTGVRAHDGDDPYLVVAADRGTATFSDTANAISEEYEFWLGDAFASGGSRGYDHKAMGITARGAWVAVQRHFRELDVDVQTEATTVVGVGDMSGDVFGNGLLQSRAVRLVGAFDHRHIFLDPDPAPEVSYRERRRLFQLPRSSWDDYDRSVLSAGGGVHSRSAKSIPLSDQARSLLRVDAAELTPPALIRALLRAPVDLLFAGGVGTFVKASAEAHSDVGDRANDAVRVDATELGARVVGEGGNLALTQRARIQYARRGGHCNTDAVDNAGGVATSDREVNLKIALRIAADHERLGAEERNALLAGMTDEVAAQVLRDVYLQTWAISREVAGSHLSLESYEHLMAELEGGSDRRARAGRLDRAVEALPGTSEMEQRAEVGAGLTRPELAVLIGYTKMSVAGALLDSDVLDWPPLHPCLLSYFPDPVTGRFGDVLGEHRLRRELVATVLANELVNRMGVTYTSRTASELGSQPAEVAAAYWAAREVVDAERHWCSIEDLDGQVTPGLQLELAAEISGLVEAFTRRYLRPVERQDLATVIDRDRRAFAELVDALPEVGSPGRSAARRGRVERYTDLGVQEELASRITTVSELSMVPDVAAVAQDSGRPVTDVAAAFFTISELLPLDALHAQLRELAVEGHWERWQLRGLTDELRDLRRDAAARAVDDHPPDVAGEDAAARFLHARAEARARVDELVERLRREPEAGLNGVAVAVRAVRELLA